jgi:hypothetical protein
MRYSENPAAFYVFILLAMAGLFSCSQERILARQYLKTNDTLNILLLTPDIVFKKNLKINSDSLPEQIRDSVSLEQSTILGKINDHLFLDLLSSQLIDELKHRKYRVFTEENMNEFMKLDSNSYIFKIAQVEVDEYPSVFVATRLYDSTEFTETLDQNSVSINLWYEVTQLNSEEKPVLIFSSDSLKDIIDGSFRRALLSYQPRYVYRRHDINIDDFYRKVTSFGSTNAEYIDDYFVNKFIHRNYNYQMFYPTAKYFHFDKQKNRVYPAGYKRFIFM